MVDPLTSALALGFFASAVLYASVGHAGASAYLAVMSLAGMATPTMRPTALVLNLVVATIASVRFAKAGLFSWRLFWPFALGSIPLAFVGGAVTLPGHWYRTLVGLILWASALRLWLDLRVSDSVRMPPVAASVASGAGIGLLAGLTGTGGGIFLSPLLLFMGWAGTRQTGGVAAAFILANSASGLAGNPGSLAALPGAWPMWAGAVAFGGAIGAELGSRRLGTPAFRKVLGVVLVIAGAKLLFS